MYSSGMRTALSLPYGGFLSMGVSVRLSQSRGFLSRGISVHGGLCPGGFLSKSLCPGESLSRGLSVWGSLSSGFSAWGGGSLCPGGVSVVQGSLSFHHSSVWEVSVQGQIPPSPYGQTDTYEIITLPQTSFAGGKNEYS